MQTPRCSRQKLPPADAAHQRRLLVDEAIGAGFPQRYQLFNEGLVSGGGENGSCENITISSGTVTATGSSGGAGIGGSGSFASDIIISGGKVTAKGNNVNYDIGSASGSSSSDGNTSDLNTDDPTQTPTQAQEP